MQKKLKISPALRNVVKISGGTILGQAISIVTLPIITRMYGAEIMGIWATILSVSLIVQAVCDMGISSGLMLEETDRGVDDLYRVISTISMIICLIAGICVFPYFKFIKMEGVFDALLQSFLVTVYAFTVKQVNTCYTWLNRYKKYNILMLNPVINYVTVAVFAIGFAILGNTKYGYFIAVILGQVLTVLNMKRQVPKRMFCYELKQFQYALKKYRDLVKFQLPNNCLLQVRDQLPSLLIGTFFGNTVLGYYSVSVKILNMPVSFIGQAVGKVFYQTISEMQRMGEQIGDYVERNFNRAINLAYFPVLGLFAVGDIAAVLFFGREYVEAGTFLRIVVFQTFFMFVITCTQGLEIVLRKQKYSLISTVVQSIFIVISIYVGKLADNVCISIILMVCVYCVIQVVYYTKLFDVINKSMKPYIKKMVGCLVSIALIAIVVRFGCKAVIDRFDIEILNWFNVGLSFRN